MRHRRARLGVSMTFAIVCAAALGVAAAQAPTSRLPKTVRPDIPLAQFCDPSSPESPVVVMAGRRLQWSRGLQPSRSPADTARAALENPRFWVAARARWLAVHDAERALTLRADCETGRVDAFPQKRPIVTLAISEFGDLAEQVTDGPTLIFPRAVTRDGATAAPPIELAPTADVPRTLAWSERRLMIVGRAAIRLVDVATGQGGAARPLPPVPLALGTDPAVAFVYNGLTYVAAGSCVDVLVGVTLTPRLRSAACASRPIGPDIVAVASRESLLVLSERGDLLEELPRPSVVHAKISGTTFDITTTLTRLIESPTVPRVPLTSGASRPGQLDTTQWNSVVPRTYWSTPRDYDRLLKDVQEKGWANLREEGSWWAGNGVALGWRRGSSFITPRGRSLSVLARLTDQAEFSDPQLRQIIADNSVLAETVEGALIERGWIPIGALLGNDATLPPSFVAPETLLRQARAFDRPGSSQLADALQAAGTCRSPVKTGTDPALTRLFREGAVAGGSLNGKVVEGAIVQGQEITVVSCVTTAGSIDIAELAKVEWADPRYKGSPLGTMPRALVAARGFDPETARSLVRSWLDRLLRSRADFDRLLLPTTSLELEFVVDARTYGGLRVAGVQFASAEAVPAAARDLQDEEACKADEAALEARLRHEAEMSLNNVDFAVRKLTPPLKIAVAENAVPLLSPMFIRDGQSIWVESKELGGFEPITPPLTVDPSTRASRFLKHGSQVAGVLVNTTAPVRGVLSDAALVWIDAMSAAKDSQPTFDKLAARKAIVNVSDRLDVTWASLSTENGNWTNGLLFVAAARNITDEFDGPPLTWIERSNVMGIGIVNDDDSLPDKAQYQRDVVDLVAPGALVPTVDDANQLGCAEGTSFATAYVSAVAAILAERAPRNWTVSQIRSRLLSTADWLPAYSGKVKGGKVNAERALNDLDKNVLVIGQGPDQLRLDVTWDDAREFEIHGHETRVPGQPKKRFRIQWSDILRWQIVASDVDGKTVESARVAFVRDGRYVVIEDATLTDNPVLPLRSCRELTNGSAVSCTGTRAARIREYTAFLYPLSGVLEFQ